MPDRIQLSSLTVHLQGQVSRDIYERATRLAFYLAQQIKRAYAAKLIASHGESGALGGILAEVRKTSQYLEINFGFSKSAHYLANLELGEHGTDSSPRGGAEFQRTKMPPSEAYLRWIKLAGITPRGGFKTKNQEAELRSLAFAMAMARKRHGIAAMRLIEKTLLARQSKIQAYLQGST